MSTRGEDRPPPARRPDKITGTIAWRAVPSPPCVTNEANAGGHCTSSPGKSPPPGPARPDWPGQGAPDRAATCWRDTPPGVRDAGYYEQATHLDGLAAPGFPAGDRKSVV